MSGPVTRKFTRDEMEDVLFGGTKIRDRIVDQHRWYNVHELIFRLPGEPENQAWRVRYKSGASEMQEQDAWDDAKEIEAVLLESYERTITDWRPVPCSPTLIG